MSGSPSTPDEVAGRLRSALEANDVASLAELLDADVSWGDCAGHDDVQHFVEQAIAAGASVGDVSVEVADDRLLVSYRVGGADEPPQHQAMFVADGRITEIRDAGDRQDARSVRPVGPLAVAADRPAEVTAVAPVLPVRDVAAAVEHYRTLGFAVDRYEGNAAYAFAERDGISLHLAQVDDLDPAVTTSALYLYVSDADAVYARWRLARPAGRLVAPVDTEYGLREGAHVDPDGNLLRFGSPSG